MFFKLKILFYLLSIKINKWIYRNNPERLRAKKWKKLQSHLLQSPFYADFSKRGYALIEYPIMNKATFMKHFDQINTAGIRVTHALNIALKAEQDRDFSPMIKGYTVGLSSGTSGNRGIFLASTSERAKWAAGVLERVIGLSMHKRSVAFFLRANSNLYESVKSKQLSFHYFDLLNPLVEHVLRLNKLHPDILVAQPSMLILLARAIEKKDLFINPNKIISVAEVLYPEDKDYLSTIFKQKIHQVYQCTEGFLAATCEYGTLHFNEDLLIIEKKYIDSEKNRFHPVITDLERYTQPVIRYELNDIITTQESCLCGKTSMPIAQIEGRSDDIFHFTGKSGKNISIFPDLLRRAIIFADQSINDYLIVQKESNLLMLYTNGTDEVYQKALKSIQLLLDKFDIGDVEIKRMKKQKHIMHQKFKRVRNDQWKKG